jgi:hypothetical protein
VSLIGFILSELRSREMAPAIKLHEAQMAEPYAQALVGLIFGILGKEEKD